MAGGGIPADKNRPWTRHAHAKDPFVGIDAHKDQVVGVMTAKRDFPSRNNILHFVGGRSDLGDLHRFPSLTKLYVNLPSGTRRSLVTISASTATAPSPAGRTRTGLRS